MLKPRFLLATFALWAQSHDLALVATDLRAVPEPGPAPELDPRALSYLERDARADEAQAVEREPPAVSGQEALAQQADDQPRVLGREHPVAPHEAQERRKAPVKRRRRVPYGIRHLGGRRARQLANGFHLRGR